MADEISDLRLLLALVSAGSLSAAAQRLDSSLPAVSRRLAAFEQRLGVRLIERHARRFNLTDEGAALHERALSILADIDEAEAEASAGKGTPRGRVRISSPVHVGRTQIAPIVAEFRDRYPDITIELMLSDAVVDVAEDDIDIVLHVGVPTAQSVVTRKLVSGRRIVLAAPAYLERFGKPAHPDDLLKHECILLMRGRRVFNRWLFKEANGVREVHVSGGLLSTSSEVVYEWILEGRGIGIKGSWDVEDDLASGRLTECLAPYACDPADLYLVYASKRHLPLRVRVLIDFLSSRFANRAAVRWPSDI